MQPITKIKELSNRQSSPPVLKIAGICRSCGKHVKKLYDYELVKGICFDCVKTVNKDAISFIDMVRGL